MADRQVLCKSSNVTLVSSKSLALLSNGTVAGRKSKVRVLSTPIFVAVFVEWRSEHFAENMTHLACICLQDCVLLENFGMHVWS